MTLPSLNFTDVDVLTATRSFLLGVLPLGTEVVRGQDNRVPEPSSQNFVVMTPMAQRRLSTNVDVFSGTDCAFLASVSGSILSISQMLIGTVVVGNQLLGVGIPPGTYVTGTITGTGGIGTYQLSGTLGVVAGTKMATGVFLALQPVEVTIQLDVHGPDSGDNAHVISTLFRDQYGVDAFAQFGTAPPNWGPIPPGGGNTIPIKYNAIAPLYADERHQAAFINDQNQYETRWVVDVAVQTNQVVTVSQAYADTIVVGLLEADLLP